MQHFTTLGNAAYKFFKTFCANPGWAKYVGRDRGGLNIFAKIGQHTRTISFPERLCAVYLRKNIQPSCHGRQYFDHAGLARNVLKNL